MLKGVIKYCNLSVLISWCLQDGYFLKSKNSGELALKGLSKDFLMPKVDWFSFLKTKLFVKATFWNCTGWEHGLSVTHLGCVFFASMILSICDHDIC